MRTVCYLAHCLLNANAKVDEGARCAGVSAPVLGLLRQHGATIRQMPCPELAFAGPLDAIPAVAAVGREFGHGGRASIP